MNKKEALFNFALWLSGCACVASAAWAFDWRLGLCLVGVALLWFSRPRLWG